MKTRLKRNFIALDMKFYTSEICFTLSLKSQYLCFHLSCKKIKLMQIFLVLEVFFIVRSLLNVPVPPDLYHSALIAKITGKPKISALNNQSVSSVLENIIVLTVGYNMVLEK